MPLRSGGEIDTELGMLNRRAKILNAPVSTGALCAVIVCLLIGSLFVLAMLALIATYVLLLVEVFVTQRSINPT